MRLLYSLLFTFLLVNSAFGYTYSPEFSSPANGTTGSFTWSGEPDKVFTGYVYNVNLNYSCNSTYSTPGQTITKETSTYFIVHDVSVIGPVGTGICSQWYIGISSSLTIPTCDPSYQYLDSTYHCVDFNASNVQRFENLAESDCHPGMVVDGATSQYTIIGYDNSGTPACLVSAIRCAGGEYWDSDQQKCINPDDVIYSNDGNCPGGDYGITKKYDFCEQCSGDSFFFQPPMGYENSGMQCNHNYVIYSCIKDYRIEKPPVEVACPWQGYQFNDMNVSSTDDLNASPTSSPTDMNNLPTIDPEEASKHNSEQLTKIELAIKDLKPILQDGTNALKNISSELNGTSSKLSSMDGKLSDIRDLIEGNNTSVDESNVSIGDGTGLGMDVAALGIDQKGIDDSSSWFDNIATDLGFLIDGMTSIQTSFEDLKTILSGDQPVFTIPSGGCSNEYLSQFGGYLAPYSSIISILTFVSFMIVIFRMVFAYLARGEN